MRVEMTKNRPIKKTNVVTECIRKNSPKIDRRQQIGPSQKEFDMTQLTPSERLSKDFLVQQITEFQQLVTSTV